jgi:hypothetical protein
MFCVQKFLYRQHVSSLSFILLLQDSSILLLNIVDNVVLKMLSLLLPFKKIAMRLNIKTRKKASRKGLKVQTYHDAESSSWILKTAELTITGIPTHLILPITNIYLQDSKQFKKLVQEQGLFVEQP